MIKEKLEQINKQVLEQLEASKDLNDLNRIRVEVLGKKGQLTDLLKSMKDVAPQDRPRVGQMVNEARASIEAAMEARKRRMEEALLDLKLKSEVIDVTLPAKKSRLGHSHPNTIALKEAERIFVGMGYQVVEGPEVERDYYNFEEIGRASCRERV